MTLLARVVFASLLAATVGAFFVAQRLKSEPAVVRQFKRTEYFSPNGDGRRDFGRISFRVTEADDVTVDVVDEEGTRVRRLVTALRATPDERFRAAWNGGTDDGARAPDGTYGFRIALRRQGRSVAAPYSVRLDMTPPSPAVIRTSSHVISPGQPVDFAIRGVGPRARPRFTVHRTDVTPPREVRRFAGRRDDQRGTWDGRDQEGRPVPPGTYLIAVTSRDRAGNEGTGPPLPPQPGRVEGRPGITVRTLAVQAPAKPVRAGALASFRVDARGLPYRWSVRRIGESRPRKRSRKPKRSSLLVFEAPDGVSGVYLLEVRSGGHAVRVPFAVQGRDRRALLVVLPVITWLGTTPLDDPAAPDGIPNTLPNGETVPYPRASTGDGLPAGFADRVAPLLVTLDRARVRYDLTTDLALAVGEDPRADDRPGVLFAGSPRWVTRPLARRLRRYVLDGGRVALMGPGSLRASVQVGATRLRRPSAIGALDALGGRISPARTIEPADEPGALPAFAALVDDPPSLPVFAGWDGVLAGFDLVEELVDPDAGGELVAAIGQPVTPEEITEAESADRPPREERPAFSVVRRGRGYVVRVGIEDWVPRLAAGDAGVMQLTRNVVDVLRRVNPRPRSTIR